MDQAFKDLCQFCRDNPSLLVFAALAAGYALGKIKVKGFSLGSTTSVLIVAIALGASLLGSKAQLHLGLIKTVSFGLFIFGIGYKVGPDFIGGLKRGGLKYVGVGVFFCVVALAAAYGLAKAFGFNAGYSAGLIGGALTQSSVIGTADSAIQQLTTGRSTVEMDLQSDIAVAYAVTYVFGTAGLIILLKVITAVWRVDLKAAAKDEESELGQVDQSESPESFQWSNMVGPRAYTVEGDSVVGKTVGQVEASMLPDRVKIDRVRKGNTVIDDITPDLVLNQGDSVLLMGPEALMIDSAQAIGPEVDDKALRDLVGEVLDICLTNKALDGKTLQEIVDGRGHGCFVRHVLRQTHELPLGGKLKLHRGDVIQVMGNRKDVERLSKAVGYAERRTDVTDLVTVGIGIILGTLLGLVAVPIAGIPITLGVGGGVLVSGLIFGWYRSTKPTWGAIPTPALWIFIDLGLNLFIACVGLAAGPRAIDALQQAGVDILLAGMCLTCIPHLATWLFGRYLLRMNPVLLLGAMTGSGTCTAALNSVRDDCQCTIPVIGYTVPYAIGNVMLTVWGALIVHLV